MEILEGYRSDDITVVMPAHNSERYIVQAINSILGQTNVPSQIIIVNNASVDNTAKCIEEVRLRSKVAIRVVDTGIPGVSNARNIGISLSKTRLVALLDSDDVYEPDFLELALKAFNVCGSFNFFFGNRKEFHGETILKENFLENTRLMNVPFKEVDEFRKVDKGLFEAMLGGSFVSCSGVVIKSNSISKTSLFPTGVKNTEDRFFFLNLSLLGSAVYSLNNTHYYRINPAGATGKADETTLFLNCLSTLTLLRNRLMNFEISVSNIINTQIEMEAEGFVYRGADLGFRCYLKSLRTTRLAGVRLPASRVAWLLIKSIKNSMFNKDLKK